LARRVGLCDDVHDNLPQGFVLPANRLSARVPLSCHSLGRLPPRARTGLYAAGCTGSTEPARLSPPIRVTIPGTQHPGRTKLVTARRSAGPGSTPPNPQGS
jgi:hypothetical protein